MSVSKDLGKNDFMKELDDLTKQREYFARNNNPAEYLALEPRLKELTYLLFEEQADFYYASCLFDNSEIMAVHHYITEARYYQKKGLTLIHSLFGSCPYYDFMNAICNARIAFYMEDYYTCIQEAHTANNLWYTKEYGQVSVPLTPLPDTFSQTVDRIGTANVLLLCNAYGKINHPADSIDFLLTMLENEAFDPYQTISAEITLAELYIINGQSEKARPFYEKYKNSDFQQDPALTAALASLSYIFETVPSAFTAALSDNTYCYSHDMFTISRYNYGLGLVSAGRYAEAISHFKSSGSHGYSMLLTLLAMENKAAEIDSLRNTVNSYFYRQIQQIVNHYNEELAYNHLAKLQYHINLSLGAYCHPLLSANAAYDFLLNTKYISLETSFLQSKQQEQSKASLPEWRLYSAAEIMNRIPENTLLIEFTQIQKLHTASYGVFLISNTDIHYVPLSDTCIIDGLITDWHQLLQDSVHHAGETSLPARWQSLNNKLRKTLYLPIKPYLTEKQRLLIAPAGTLITFPFSRLSCSADGFLGDFYRITYLNTGKELCHTKNNPLQKKALVIGNPATDTFPNLPFAETEADMVSYFLQTTPYKKEDASLTNVLSAVKSAPSILHIAAHGIYHPVPSDITVDWDTLYHAMTKSGIVLADDTLLSCAQIGTLNLSSVRLAVLSCCHSAKAAYLGTEGAYGLRRALCAVGCDTIIANLWQVDDSVSFLFMKSFYEHLTISGDTIEDSFFAAVESIKTYSHNGSTPFQDPFYWSGFLLVSAG